MGAGDPTPKPCSSPETVVQLNVKCNLLVLRLVRGWPRVTARQNGCLSLPQVARLSPESISAPIRLLRLTDGTYNPPIDTA